MSLFSDLISDPELKDIDDRIDNLFGVIPKDHLDTTSADDLTGSVLDSIFDGSSKDEVSKLFENITVPHERIQRYMVYDELNRAVPIIKRILRVYVSNILQKNPVDGKCIIYKDVIGEDSQEFKNAKKYSKETFKKFNIVNKLKIRILPLMLLYGDCFVEIINIKKSSKDIKISDTNYLLNECNLLINEIKDIENKYNSNIFESKTESIFKHFSNIIIKESKVENDVIEGNNVLFRIHKPHNIISLVNDYGTCIGFLEIEKQDSVYDNFNNIGKTLANSVGRITTIGNRNSVSSDDIIDKLISYTLRTIIEKNKDNFNSEVTTDNIIKNLDPNVHHFLKRMIIEQGLDKKKKINQLKVKFISPTNMVQFSIPSSDYFPYGESVIDPLVFPSKLYILAQLANVITKLSRASLVRKWTIDTGPTQMHSGMIQKLKRELYNTRVTLEDLSSFKSIPKILSDYKDMFILSKNGQKSLDVEVASHGDPTIKIADLEDARREIISLSGVPAPLN